jgi:eukaryotic-like serine/threonine-protein kinase
MIGKTLWKYKITEFLGSGGSAKVWKAYDERTKREVAIKVLPEDFDSMLLTRFKHETRTISQLDHPHIIKIHDIGTEGKTNYYVMEYVKGKTLKELVHERWELEGGSIRSEEVTRLGREMASALDYIHQRRIYHRDIKPGNILITDDGRSILMDFGIAKAKDDASLTAAGTLMGTPLYMSP